MNANPINPINSPLPNPESGAPMPIAPVKPARKPWPVPEYDSRDLWMAAGATAAGFLFTRLLLTGGHGLGVAAALGLLTGVALLYLRDQRQAAPRDAKLFLFFSAALAAFFAVSDDWRLKPLALLAFFPTLSYAVLILRGRRVENRIGPALPVELADALVVTPAKQLLGAPSVVLSGIGRAKQGRNLLLLLAGGLLALPLFLTVCTKLLAADAVFSGIWDRLTTNFFEAVWINGFYLALALPLIWYLFAALFGARKAEGPRYDAQQTGRLGAALRIAPPAMALGAVLPILLLYAVFFFSQTAYFLSAFQGLLPQTVPLVSDYARNGFFELCTVSGINLTLIAAMQLLCKGGDRVKRWLTALLCGCSLGLIAIALSKMLLYIKYYGLTPKRLYTSWFMLFLAVVFGLILAWLVKPKRNPIRGMVLAGAAMFLILCFASPARLISEYNFYVYRTGRLSSLDASMLAQQDVSTTGTMIKAAESGVLTYSQKRLLEYNLVQRYNYYRNRNWASHSLASLNALRQLEEWMEQRDPSDIEAIQQRIYVPETESSEAN